MIWTTTLTGEELGRTPTPDPDDGVEPDGAVLVRPDGFVAWRARCAPADPGAALRCGLTTALARR